MRVYKRRTHTVRAGPKTSANKKRNQLLRQLDRLISFLASQEKIHGTVRMVRWHYDIHRSRVHSIELNRASVDLISIVDSVIDGSQKNLMMVEVRRAR